MAKVRIGKGIWVGGQDFCGEAPAALLGEHGLNGFTLDEHQISTGGGCIWNADDYDLRR